MSLGERILITGGLVIDPSQNLEAARDLLLENGKVAAVGQKLPGDGCRRIDASGRWVLPGLIDMHVHLREPGREQDETIASGTRAAAAGGVTTVLAMPNTEPVIDTPAMVEFLLDRARAEGLVNVLASGAVTRGQKGAELSEMGRMAAAGAVAVTDDGRPIMNAQVMRRALEYARGFALPILDHCEDENLSAGGVMNEGPHAAAKGVGGIPVAAESVMAMRDIALAELTGGRLHLCHVSAAATIELLRRAKERGVPVTAEAAPHHFTLIDEDVSGYDADFKMNPPLRREEDREAVCRALAEGVIDAIATDHAPHGPGKKALGLAAAPFGVIGLETLLPLTLRLVERRALSRRRAVELLSTAPARILSLKAKGSLKPGMDADVTIVDPSASYVADRFESRSRNSPFRRWKLKGRAETVIVGGRLVLEKGDFAPR